MGLPGWKRLDVCQPPQNKDILTYPGVSAVMDVGRCWWDNNGNFRWSIAGTSGGGIGKNVTHWQELPSTPE